MRPSAILMSQAMQYLLKATFFFKSFSHNLIKKYSISLTVADLLCYIFYIFFYCWSEASQISDGSLYTILATLWSSLWSPTSVGTKKLASKRPDGLCNLVHDVISWSPHVTPQQESHLEKGLADKPLSVSPGRDEIRWLFSQDESWMFPVKRICHLSVSN